MEAADHGKPIRSGTAFIHIILTEYPAANDVINSVAATQPSPPRLSVPPPPSAPQFTVNPPVLQETPRFNPSAAATAANGAPQPQKLLLEGGGMFSRNFYKVQVVENTAPLTSIMSLKPELMTDLSNVNLRLIGSNHGIFGIQETTGDLILTGSPDREFQSSYTLTVKVRKIQILD